VAEARALIWAQAARAAAAGAGEEAVGSWVALAMAVAAGAQGLARELEVEAEGATARCAVRGPAQAPAAVEIARVWPPEVAAAGMAAGFRLGTAAAAMAAAVAVMRPRSAEHARAVQGCLGVQATEKMVRGAATVALGLLVMLMAAERAVAAKGTLSASWSQAKAVPETRQTIADQHAKTALTPAPHAGDNTS